MLKDIKKKGPWQGLWTLNANVDLGKGCGPFMQMWIITAGTLFLHVTGL